MLKWVVNHFQHGSNLDKNISAISVPFSRFGVKSAVLGSAVYYTVDKGVWKDSATTSAIYEDLESGVSPYVGELKKQIPYEVCWLRLFKLLLYYFHVGNLIGFSYNILYFSCPPSHQMIDYPIWWNTTGTVEWRLHSTFLWICQLTQVMLQSWLMNSFHPH